MPKIPQRKNVAELEDQVLAAILVNRLSLYMAKKVELGQWKEEDGLRSLREWAFEDGFDEGDFEHYIDEIVWNVIYNLAKRNASVVSRGVAVGV